MPSMPAAVLVVLMAVAGRTATSGDDGRFKFIGVKPGKYKLAGGGERGLSHETTHLEVAEAASSREVRLALRVQQELELEILSSRGLPAPRATIIELSGKKVASVRETDDAGKVRLPRFGSGPRAIVVVAGDGTLHAQPLPHDSEGSSLRIHMPPAAAMIEIVFESRDDHAPIAGVSLAMRYNGVLFPEEAIELMSRRMGVLLKSGPTGRVHLPRVPAGMYEFWPIRSRSDLVAVLSGHPGAAPIVIPARPGDNVAKLTFSRMTTKESP